MSDDSWLMMRELQDTITAYQHVVDKLTKALGQVQWIGLRSGNYGMPMCPWCNSQLPVHSANCARQEALDVATTFKAGSEIITNLRKRIADLEGKVAGAVTMIEEMQAELTSHD